MENQKKNQQIYFFGGKNLVIESSSDEAVSWSLEANKWEEQQEANFARYFIGGTTIVERFSGELLFHPNDESFTYDEMIPDDMLFEISNLPEEHVNCLKFLRGLDLDVEKELDLRICACTFEEKDGMGYMKNLIAYFPPSFTYFQFDVSDVEYLNETTIRDLFDLWYMWRLFDQALLVSIAEDGHVTVIDPDAKEKQKEIDFGTNFRPYFEPRFVSQKK